MSEWAVNVSEQSARIRDFLEELSECDTITEKIWWDAGTECYGHY